MSPVGSVPSSAGPQELPPCHFLSVFALQVAITGISVKFTVKNLLSGWRMLGLHLVWVHPLSPLSQPPGLHSVCALLTSPPALKGHSQKDGRNEAVKNHVMARTGRFTGMEG